MDPGAHADRRANRFAHARRHGVELALTRSSIGSIALLTSASLIVCGLPGGAACSALPGDAARDTAQGDAAVGGASGAEPGGVATGVAFDWHLPRGFPTPAVPTDNPMSDTKVALGRRLFFEPRLSITGQNSCASCHEPTHAFSDGRAVAVGATGQMLPRGAMALINVAYNISYGWTKPQLQSLETQMLEPLLNEHPVELGLAGREPSVCAQLSEEPAYRAAFAESFPQDASPVTFDHVVKAIAAFERTLISGHSPFDRYVFSGDHEALSAQAKHGMELFYSPRSGCGSCHSGFNFDGNWRDAQGETGKPSFANNGTSEQPMRVPTLRNIALTAPYMHDGRFPTLEAVLDHYASVATRLRSDQIPTGAPRAADPTGFVLEPREKLRAAHGDSAAHGNRAAGSSDSDKLRSFALSDGERLDLIAFLNALTDEEFVNRYAGR